MTLARQEHALGERFASAEFYDPAFCSFVQALYRDGQYIRAYEAGVRLHRLAEKSDQYWSAKYKLAEADDHLLPAYLTALQNCFFGYLPTGPLRIAAKALRAEARRLKKAGQIQEVPAILKLIQTTGHATANDTKMLERLTGQPWTRPDEVLREGMRRAGY